MSGQGKLELELEEVLRFPFLLKKRCRYRHMLEQYLASTDRFDPAVSGNRQYRIHYSHALKNTGISFRRNLPSGGK